MPKDIFRPSSEQRRMDIYARGEVFFHFAVSINNCISDNVFSFLYLSIRNFMYLYTKKLFCTVLFNALVYCNPSLFIVKK